MASENSSAKRVPSRKSEKQHWMAVGLKILLPIFALTFIGAMIFDIQKATQDISSGSHTVRKEARIQRDLDRLEEGLAAERISGPSDKFSIVPPAGWELDEDGIDGYFDLTFRGMEGLEINLLASDEEYSDFAVLRRTIERKEIDIGLHMHIVEDEFNGHAALYRTCQLETQKLYMIDFLANGRAHHLLFAAPYELYETYLPIVQEIMKTYRP